MRLVLDQNGDPWPEDASAEAVVPETLDKSRAFRLSARLDKAGVPYDRAAVLDRVAGRLSGDSEGGQQPGRVVILIRGFDNSFAAFRTKYAAMRGWLAQEGARPARYLDVYWDALHRGSVQAGYPFGRFVRSRTNAERAGRCGLRAVLARFPPGTEVTVVTHSLGAEVGLAALSERPPGRGHVRCGAGEATPVPRHLGDVRMLAFAPAIGRVQLLDGDGRANRDTLGAITRFYLGYNPNDPAVTKRNKGVDLPDWLGGDTRLGGNAGFIAKVRAQLDKAGRGDAFQTLVFAQPDHAMARYLEDRPRARCMIWAGGLLRDKPEGCLLER